MPPSTKELHAFSKVVPFTGHLIIEGTSVFHNE